ncbi:Tm-1-like ATP-binding domain-containing protein [Ferrovibrio sp.]|uniref:Tm-1-like ATP-binding domain-containing protein n=1 Tax=Ferrovibrio sp. TaxID=1917215 RepID=UPI0025C55339|nr:Tm-1-like ATP-binding domain-containing protein [Ferrovibrio sp.]MBX3452905.1 Tm-1-like ATP-binding domain-containing protein [Ferrovibrio sp.]
MAGTAYVIGTFDTKAAELNYVAGLLRAANLPVVTVDVGTHMPAADADYSAEAVADYHPQGRTAVLNLGDRGAAVTAMTQALLGFMAARRDVGGMLGLGGSGGTSIIAPAMRGQPIGLPKLMVSTLAAGDVGPFVGVHDITMMYPVTDISGLNRLSRVILGNAAHALAGMMRHAVPVQADSRPALGFSMFGVTTPCIQQLTARLSNDFECQVFHANGPGGRSLEAIAGAGLLQGMVDITTTEAADHLLGGVCTAGPERFDVVARTGIPWVGSCGALDMVNFWAPETIPSQYSGRLFHAHNANVTLMRTTAEELQRIAAWISAKLNASSGPVRLLLPEGGTSMLDAPGQKFHDPAANAALFAAFERHFLVSDSHKLIRVPHHINEPAFVGVAEQHVRAVMARA